MARYKLYGRRLVPVGSKRSVQCGQPDTDAPPHPVQKYPSNTR